jgi:signal transduction histidine kinase
VRRRLLFSYLILTLVILVVLEVPLAITYREREVQSLEAKLERDAFVIASYAEDTLEGTANADLQGLVEAYEERTGGRVVIVDAAGDVQADPEPLREGSRSFESRPEIQTALNQEVAVGTRESASLGATLLYVAVPVSSGGEVHGAVRITYPTSEVDSRVSRYWALLAGVGAIALAGAAGAGILLARWVTKPVDTLRSAAEALGEGHLNARAPTDAGPPEVRALAQALNTTAGRLEDLVHAQEQFVADASHQLRTPLTALRLRLEMLDLRTTDETDRADISAAEIEVARLARLVDGLMSLARADRAPATETTSRLDVNAALLARAAIWEPVATERNVVIGVESTDVTLRADPDRLDQVLDNYITNALEVAPPNSAVNLRAWAVTVAGVGRVTEIHVTDEGPGLTAEERRLAFERFWRAKPGAGDLGGSGLGLAIVRKLVRLDNGTCELREGPSGGIDAVATYPS